MEAEKGFQLLPLSPSLLQALERAGYQEPTPIQQAVISEALAGTDIIGQAQTGTGKTAAFLLPFLNNWSTDELPGPVGLVLAPTRELVVQVTQEANKLVPQPECRALAIYGGQRFGQQARQLRQGSALIVGTPGRVLDHLSRGTLSLDKVRYVVLDEADRMLDIGFRPDIERILRRCPEKRQTMLFSATVPPPVHRLSTRYMVDPVHINVSPEKLTVDKIRQAYFSVDEERKFELLVRVIEREQPRQCIIFCERKIWAEDVYRRLRQVLRRAAVMHGDLSQGLRNRIMQGFRDGKLSYLVATDVVGRGIDVKNISHVINYDLPDDPENYVHRIGRTGRIGADGVAIAFVTPEQGKQLTAIETLINVELKRDEMEGFRTVKQRPAQEEEAEKKPVHGRRRKRYSNRL
jgi:ATP-dependent RNA helicase DeaD